MFDWILTTTLQIAKVTNTKFNLYNNKRQPGISQILRVFKRIEIGDAMCLFVWRLWNIIPSKTSIFTIAVDLKNLVKSDPTTYAFLKIFNNFQNSCFTKQLWTAVFYKKVGNTLWSVSLSDKICLDQYNICYFCPMEVP